MPTWVLWSDIDILSQFTRVNPTYGYIVSPDKSVNVIYFSGWSFISILFDSNGSKKFFQAAVTLFVLASEQLPDRLMESPK